MKTIQSKRQLSVAESIKRIISMQIHQDPIKNIISRPDITVTKANITADLKKIKIYISIIEKDINKINAVILLLNNNKNIFKKAICDNIRTKFTTDVEFFSDDMMLLEVEVEKALNFKPKISEDIL